MVHALCGDDTVNTVALTEQSPNIVNDSPTDCNDRVDADGGDLAHGNILRWKEGRVAVQLWRSFAVGLGKLKPFVTAESHGVSFGVVAVE